MSAYEELRRRCSEALWKDGKYQGVDVVLTEIFRTLENSAEAVVRPHLRRDLIAWLRVSPLAAPAEKETEG